jgi:hypothetical protein
LTGRPNPTVRRLVFKIGGDMKRHLGIAVLALLDGMRFASVRRDGK